MKRTQLIVGAAVAALVIGFLLFRPDTLFFDNAVDESLDDAFAAPTTDASVADDPIDDEQTEDSAGVVDSIPDDSMTDETMTDETRTDETVAPTTTASAGPVSVATGSFVGVDHTASGSAAIYEQDGSYVLRFEDDTDIQNGPDLYVWLVPDTDWHSPGEDHLELGTLKGNLGGQNYELPAEYDPEVHRHVLVWCLRFGVPFAAAELG